MKELRNELNIELPRAKGAYLEDAPDSIWTEPGWVLEPKEDGIRDSLQIGSIRSILVGRNREDKLHGVEKAGPFMVHRHPIFSHIALTVQEDTILDGECTMHFTQDGEYDETTKVRMRNGQFIGFTVWGVLFYKGNDVRCMHENYRRKAAQIAVTQINNPHIRMIDRFPATREKLAEIHATGEEGAIAKYLPGIIPTDQRTCPTWWKLKTAMTVDAFIVGVTEGKEGGSGVQGVKPLPNGKAASFTVAMLGNYVKGITRGMKILTVAKVKHLPDDVAEEGLRNFENYKNKVIELRVSGWNGKSFRWARWIKIREDKTAMDCIFDEQVGK